MCDCCENQGINWEAIFEIAKSDTPIGRMAKRVIDDRIANLPREIALLSWLDKSDGVGREITFKRRSPLEMVNG